jgi:hypothetical protein
MAIWDYNILVFTIRECLRVLYIADYKDYICNKYVLTSEYYLPGTVKVCLTVTPSESV